MEALGSERAGYDQRTSDVGPGMAAQHSEWIFSTWACNSYL